MPGFFGYKKACEMFTFVLENKFFLDVYFS